MTSGMLFVVTLVALAMSVPLSRIWSRHLRETRRRSAEEDAQIADLQARVEVLERIVTDDRSRLNGEFDRLRERRTERAA